MLGVDTNGSMEDRHSGLVSGTLPGLAIASLSLCLAPSPMIPSAQYPSHDWHPLSYDCNMGRTFPLSFMSTLASYCMWEGETLVTWPWMKSLGLRAGVLGILVFVAMYELGGGRALMKDGAQACEICAHLQQLPSEYSRADFWMNGWIFYRFQGQSYPSSSSLPLHSPSKLHDSLSCVSLGKAAIIRVSVLGPDVICSWYPWYHVWVQTNYFSWYEKLVLRRALVTE